MRILIVDDEQAARYGIRRALQSGDYHLAEAATVAAARVWLNANAVDLILLDVNMPGENGLDFLAELQTSAHPPLVVIITAHGSERTAAAAIKSGAFDYLAKPYDIDELRLIVKNARETVRLQRENQALKHTLRLADANNSILIGTSPAMQRVRQLIAKVAETDATVLIRGETGTGKELVARAIHQQGFEHRTGNFVAVNCAALPAELIESELFGHEKGAFTGASARHQGKFEQADGGTLFLDEIGDMNAALQAKLLRALEEKRIEPVGGKRSLPVDARIISATHRDLENEIADGKFRADLFFRLCVVTIDVPPLRARPEDVLPLTEHFLRRAALHFNRTDITIAPTALAQLTAYHFPGNIRELRNIIDRAVVLAEDGTEIKTFELASHAASDITHRYPSDNAGGGDVASRRVVDEKFGDTDDRGVSNSYSTVTGNSSSAAFETLTAPADAKSFAPSDKTEMHSAGPTETLFSSINSPAAVDLPIEPPTLSSSGDKADDAESDGKNEAAVITPYTGDFRSDKREFEKIYLTKCLDEHDGNVTRTAAKLGMHRQSLQHKLRELGLARRYVNINIE